MINQSIDKPEVEDFARYSGAILQHLIEEANKHDLPQLGQILDQAKKVTSDIG